VFFFKKFGLDEDHFRSFPGDRSLLALSGS